MSDTSRHYPDLEIAQARTYQSEREPDYDLNTPEIRQIRLIDQIESEIRTNPFVQYIITRAQADHDAALVAPSRVDPENTAEIRRLQNEVKRFTDLVYWIGRLDEMRRNSAADAEEAEDRDPRM